MRGMDLWILAMISSILFLSHILPSPKDTHKEVYGSHSDIVIYPPDNPSKFFPNPYRCSFYMPLILQLRPPLSVISLQHQPLISPSSKQNTELAIT
jgi:hypothetical protein